MNRVPSVGVAAGSHIFIYRNMRPYKKVRDYCIICTPNLDSAACYLHHISVFVQYVLLCLTVQWTCPQVEYSKEEAAVWAAFK